MAWLAPSRRICTALLGLKRMGSWPTGMKHNFSLEATPSEGTIPSWYLVQVLSTMAASADWPDRCVPCTPPMGESTAVSSIARVFVTPLKRLARAAEAFPERGWHCETVLAAAAADDCRPPAFGCHRAQDVPQHCARLLSRYCVLSCASVRMVLSACVLPCI